jgi:hypothetical protein
VGLRAHIPILWEVRVEHHVPVTKERVDVPTAYPGDLRFLHRGNDW